MTAVLLALLTAVSYGVANFIGPRLSLVHTLSPVLVVGQVVGVTGGLLLVAANQDALPGTRAVGFGVVLQGNLADVHARNFSGL